MLYPSPQQNSSPLRSALDSLLSDPRAIDQYHRPADGTISMRDLIGMLAGASGPLGGENLSPTPRIEEDYQDLGISPVPKRPPREITDGLRLYDGPRLRSAPPMIKPAEVPPEDHDDDSPIGQDELDGLADALHQRLTGKSPAVAPPKNEPEPVAPHEGPIVRKEMSIQVIVPKGAKGKKAPKKAGKKSENNR